MAFFGIFAIMLMFGAIYILMALALWVIETVGKWQVYRKLEIPSWKCLIPYYNNYVEFKRVWEVKYNIVWLFATICLAFLPSLTDDIGFFDIEDGVDFPLRKNTFIIVFPYEPHTPGLSLGNQENIRKIVAKIPFN